MRLDQFKRAVAKVKARREAEALVSASADATKANLQSSVPNTTKAVVLRHEQMTDAEQAEADEQFRLKLQTTIIGHFQKLKGVSK